MMFKRPMLAASLLPSNVEHTDENILAAMQKLRYPVMSTEKRDGIRAIRAAKTLLSRTLKLIPNKSIRARAEILPGGYDMELYTFGMQYNQIESIVMSQEHKDSDRIDIHVLDTFGIENATYEQRMWHIHKDTSCWVEAPFEFEMPTWHYDANSLFERFLGLEDSMAEGICFRTPNSPYKQGRSTLKEQYLVKLSRYHRRELTITGFKEQMENCNEEKRNELGLMKRTTNQDNMLGKNTLGAFVCYDSSGGTVDVGTGVGLTDKLRREIWQNREQYVGKQITVKHKPHGAKDKIRHPIFVGFREKGY